MNTPGGRPPAKLWRFLALGAVNWRSCFWLDFLDAILFFGRKTSVVEVFQHYVWKINLCLCLDTSTDSRWSTLIVKTFQWSRPPEKLWRFLTLGVVNWRILLVFSKNTAGLGSGSPPRIDQSVVFVEDFQDLVQLCLNIVVEDIPMKALMPNSVQLYQKTSNNSATTTIKHLSLYEHPRRPSTRETLTIFDLGSSELEKLSSLKIRRDFLDAVLYFGRKPAWLKIFRKWKIKLCLCLDV